MDQEPESPALVFEGRYQVAGLLGDHDPMGWAVTPAKKILAAALQSSWLYVSGNGGRTFEAGPERGLPGYSFGDVLASPSPGVVLFSRAHFGSCDLNEQDLRASFDGGHQWSVAYRGQPLYLGFTSPAQGVGMQSSKRTTTLIMTFDGGHHWGQVNF
jgi:hypothetical protein